MKITYAGQIDHPAIMKLERAEKNVAAQPVPEQQSANTRPADTTSVAAAPVPEYDPCEGDETYRLAATPEPSPREALREGDLVMCNPALTKEWHPARVTKLGKRYIQAQYASDRTSAWDKDHWRFPTSAELSEHATFLLSQEPKCPN